MLCYHVKSEVETLKYSLGINRMCAYMTILCIKQCVSKFTFFFSVCASAFVQIVQN